MGVTAHSFGRSLLWGNRGVAIGCEESQKIEKEVHTLLNFDTSSHLVNHCLSAERNLSIWLYHVNILQKSAVQINTSEQAEIKLKKLDVEEFVSHVFVVFCVVIHNSRKMHWASNWLIYTFADIGHIFLYGIMTLE